MPIQVEIQLNEKTLRTIHIARVNEIVEGDNDYLVLRTPGSTSIPKESLWEDEGISFQHKRGNIETLVVEGLTALAVHDEEMMAACLIS